MDINDIRDLPIKAFGLVGADSHYVFYYDETNNIKKLRIKEDRFNVSDPSVFVLGGVVHSGPPRVLDIQSLRDAMRIQKSAPEIKFEHVAKGGFIDVLKSNKIAIFLQWIADNDLLAHYHALDPIHWALVDIIDSILHGLAEPHFYALHHDLKADLTALLRADLGATASMFYRYDYPNLTPENRKPFLNDLLCILEREHGLLPDFNAMMLKGMLQAGRNIPSMEFIEGFEPHELIQDFSIFYVNRIAIFKNSEHILDDEDTVQKEIDAMKLSSGGQLVGHYRFSDSKSEPGIQISDVVAGLIGKMYTWLVQTPAEEVVTARASLDGVALKNAELLRDLIDASDEANIAFLHHVISTRDLEKMNIFLRTVGSGFEV
ncbi:hypothetical protein GCM10011367_16300 [Marinicauda pacifica]|uniref:DUF3800 domain-containing protein n=1 Tax=Marinicauda pacifica TaxID=1133559 RepID=A0A4V3RZ62_9PROT|nr:DUF3800 domain-containing protein [Marinicauda pacifica]TGY93039.1 hypothetical protein E5162_08225 [Marinicauda pacifica]GGE42315.1 hypothetical protein GCM10011367_16300 [Marinicauda pacifica]